MYRVIIVSPNFPPTNGADMHRVRLVLPHLARFGWEPIVVAASPDAIHMPQDQWLADGIPAGIKVYRAATLGLAWSKIPGLGCLDFRALHGLKNSVNRVVREQECDLIYFSTTCFGVHVLGPYWRGKFGVPFAMDYQDPWVSDYYRKHPDIVPPGGRLKYAVVDRLNRYREPRVLRKCSGITSVSPMYPLQLRDRYPWLSGMPAKVLPFPGASRDLDRIRQVPVEQPYFSRSDGLRHWVYVGRGGGDMAFALSAFFQALGRWKGACPDEFARTRIHFIGTSYAPSGRGKETILPLAEQYGVASIVTEVTARIPYSQMLSCLIESDALIVPGSDDAAYTASKIYPYLLAKKPLLAVFHAMSSVVDVISKVQGGRLITFDGTAPVSHLASEIYSKWFQDEQFNAMLPLNEAEFDHYTDIGCARQLSEFFHDVRIGARQ